MANVLDYDIIVSEFKFLSCYYVHFRTITPEKDVKSLIPSYEDTAFFFYKNGFGIY